MQDLQAETYIVPELGLKPGRPTLWFGEGGSGKTTVTTAMCVALAGGEPVWGVFKGSRLCRVIHIDYEIGFRVTAKKVRKLFRGLGFEQDDLAELCDRDAYVIESRPDFRLVDSDARKKLCDMVRGFDIVLIDSLTHLATDIEENSAAIGRRLEILSNVSDETGACFNVIHHTDKGGRKARGSTSIFNMCDNVFKIQKRADDAIVVKDEKNALGTKRENVVLRIGGDMILDSPTPLIVSTENSLHIESRSEDIRTMVLSAITENQSKFRNADEIAAAVGKRKSYVLTAIKTLTDANLITKVSGKYCTTHIP